MLIDVDADVDADSDVDVEDDVAADVDADAAESQSWSPWSRIRNISGQSSWTGYLRWGNQWYILEQKLYFQIKLKWYVVRKGTNHL